MKTSRLSSIEHYAIKAMLAEKKSVEEIADILNRTKRIIQNYVDTIKDKTFKKTIQDASYYPEKKVFTPNPESDKPKTLLEKMKPRDILGVVVMTPEISQRLDGQKMKPHINKNIWTIDGDHIASQ